MKEYLQTFKEYWSFILIAIYSVAYLYNYLYFSFFSVNVFQYTAISDLLFFSVEQILFISILLLIFESAGIFLVDHFFNFFIYKKIIEKLKIKVKAKKIAYSGEEVAKIVKKMEDRKTPTYLLYYAFFLSFLSVFLSYLPLINLTKSVVVTAGFAYLILRLFYLAKKRTADTALLKVFAFGAVYIYAILMLCLQSTWNASDVINEKITEHHLSFDYLGKSYKVEHTLRFIGETSTYIFLYNKTEESTLIFPKTKIDNLTTFPKDSFLFNRVKNSK